MLCIVMARAHFLRETRLEMGSASIGTIVKQPSGTVAVVIPGQVSMWGEPRRNAEPHTYTPHVDGRYLCRILLLQLLF